MSTGLDDAARTARLAGRPPLLDAVRDLRRAAEATRFPVALEGTARAQESRDRLLDQLDGHVIPRLVTLSAPAVVVVAGSTGAGKSTLLNSILGSEVSPAGVLRPTTRRPVLVHHPEDGELLAEHPLLGVVDVVEHANVPRGIALVDAPDLDSLEEANRAMAHRLLEAADLWLFATTAARYGDALPWDVLERARERGLSTAVVLNRVPSDALVAVRSDLLGRLRQAGMSSVPLFIVPDVGPHEGLLEAADVAPVTRWLVTVAGSDRARAVVLRTLRGALLGLRPWVDDLAEAVQAQVDAADLLRRGVRIALAEQAEEAVASLGSGAIADGSVRTRWDELVGDGGAFDGLIRRGRLRVPARVRAERVRQLSRLAEAVTDAVAAALVSAGVHARGAALRALLAPEAPDGAAGLAEQVEAAARGPIEEARAERARKAASSWTQAARAAVQAAQSGAGRNAPVARAVRAIGVDGVAAVALAAAIGLGGAAALAEALLGADATTVRDELADDLARHVRDQVTAEREDVLAPLHDPDLAPDAAAVLRVRLAVLKDLS